MSQDLAIPNQAEVEAFIAHHGVKGMRWGVRRSSDGSSGGSGKAPKEKISDESIMNARYKHQARVDKIIEADKDYRLATTEKGRKTALDTVKKHADDAVNDPETRLAMRYTSGERMANLILLGPIGALDNHFNKVNTSKERWAKSVNASNQHVDAVRALEGKG